MKTLFKVFAAAALTTAATGCSDFLDINENPNNPTTAAPDAILAQALTNTANTYAIGFNHYGNFVVGDFTKSGTVNGYTTERTYVYTSSFQQGLFNATYDNLQDYQAIQTNGTATNQRKHAAIARIMKVYNYQLLVDQYGDIPYSEALKGLGNLTPKYDKAEDIYKDFIVQLDGAIADIDAALADGTVPNVGQEDVVFGGNMDNWKRFANSLKLRVLLRQSEVPGLQQYLKEEFAKLEASKDGFITTDVVAQPGYTQSAGKQNPFYERYGFTSSNTRATENRYQIPTNFLLGNYVDNNDPRVYRLYNQVGGKYVGSFLGEGVPPLGQNASLMRRFGGLLKGPDAPTPLMLLAEVQFSKAEAKVLGLMTGDAKADYDAGIQASFEYFYRPAPSQRGSVTNDSSALVNAPLYEPTKKDSMELKAGTITQAQLNTKIRLNSGKIARYTQLFKEGANPNVNYDLAPDKRAVILLQKYLALNTVAGIESWDDYRRTGLPNIPVSTDAAVPGKLPVRLLYPLSEVTTNSSNVPQGIDNLNSRIFWDVN